MAVTLVPLALALRHIRDIAVVALHAGALLLGAVLLATRAPSKGVLRRWYPFAMVLPAYLELHRLIAAVGQPHRDALVAHWEHAMFPSNPSHTLSLAFP